MMNPRKTMGRASPLFLVLLALGFFFLTYNLLTMIIHNRGIGLDGVSLSSSSDPIIQMPENVRGLEGGKLLFHVALTATDAPYSKWQCRIMYYWYKKVKEMPESEMGGFTRVLHSGSPDNLMDEIPTFVVDPLPAGLDRGYIVLNRPWAFVQWLEKATIEEEYVLMAEPDHVFVNPLPNLARGGFPAAFPFFYIKPTEHEKIIRKFYPEEMGPVTNVDPIGNSPVIIKKSVLEKVASTWMNVSLSMKDDPETDKAFGWVLEMYAYAVASALHGVQHILQKDFMLQPPWDLEVEKKFIIHYTYGCDYSLKGELTYGKIGEWRFDKRSYLRGPPPKNLSLPPPGVPESVPSKKWKENKIRITTQSKEEDEDFSHAVLKYASPRPQTTESVLFLAKLYRQQLLIHIHRNLLFVDQELPIPHVFQPEPTEQNSVSVKYLRTCILFQSSLLFLHQLLLQCLEQSKLRKNAQLVTLDTSVLKFNHHGMA